MSPDDRDQGFSLVEILIAIVIMSIGVATIFGGLALFLRVERSQTIGANVDAQLRTVAEKVLNATYVDCATNTSYSTPATPAAGFTSSLVVTYWDGNLPPTTWNTSCSSDKGIQRIVLTLTPTAAGGSAQSVTVVKSRCVDGAVASATQVCT